MKTSTAGPISIVLAAGKGTRMGVEAPKVLMDIHGSPMLEFALNGHRDAGVQKIIVVTGYRSDLVCHVVGGSPAGPDHMVARNGDAGPLVECVFQKEQLGTGHAVLQAESLLTTYDGIVLISMGDMPFITGDMYKAMLAPLQQDDEVVCSVLGLQWPHDRSMPGFGRFIRSADGSLEAIVEEKDATPAQREIRELNTNVYAVRSKELFAALHRVHNNNAQGEYYLTDIVHLFVQDGKKIVPVITTEIDRAIGVNTPEQLEYARTLHKERGYGGDHKDHCVSCEAV